MRYARLRSCLPKEKGEVKGRLLDEAEVASVVALLKRYDVLFEVSAVDLSGSDQFIPIAKQKLAAAMVKNLTDEHRPELRENVQRYVRRMHEMPPQLFLQTYLTWDVVERVLRHSPYYRPTPPEGVSQVQVAG